jgi:hypothetical protein
VTVTAPLPRLDGTELVQAKLTRHRGAWLSSAGFFSWPDTLRSGRADDDF